MSAAIEKISEKSVVGQGAHARVFQTQRHRLAVRVLAISFALFQVATAAPFLLPFPNLIQRSIHLCFAFVLCFYLYPARPGKSPESRPSLLDGAMMFVVVAVFVYPIVYYDWIMENPYTSTPYAIVLGSFVILFALETSRRTIGLVFTALAVIALLYALLGSYLPGTWGHSGFNWATIVEMLFLSTQGILGPVTGISASVVAIFLIFGAILYHTGGGETFIELAKLIARDSTGGPAKVAIFSSAFFGTISGSSVANVTVSGIFSIPLMKSMGYKKELAAAVEATASTGGQILPPVMGAGAFIMAELIGRSYLEIAIAATLPALLYYIGLTAGVHLKAHRQNLPRIKKEDIPKARDVFAWRRSMGLFVPVAILIYFLIRGYTPATSTFWAIVASVSIYMSSAASWKDLRIRMTKMVQGLEAGAKGIVMVATLVAAAGVIIAMINLTGIGVKVSEFIIGISDRQILVSLIFGMIVCLVLGMGLPTTAAYVLAASVVAPSLISLGIEPLPAHLFVFYFAIISSITPPVCAAVFVASALADANWVRTAFIATQLGLAGFIVPYMFVLSPALLLNGPVLEVAQAAVTAIIGVIALAAGAEGYLLRRANLLERAFLLSSAILLIKPGLYTDAGGFLLILVTLALLKFRPGPQLNLAERRLPEMISGKGVVNEKS